MTSSRVAAGLLLLFSRVTAGCTSERVDIAAPLAVTGPIAVLDAYAPEPVTPDVAALYMTFRNSGAEPDRVLAVVVEAADRAEIHHQAQTGSMVRMEELASVELPPGATVALAPGGVHVMLMDVKAYAVGDSLRVVVTLERNGELAFQAPVIAYADVADRANREGERSAHD